MPAYSWGLEISRRSDAISKGILNFAYGMCQIIWKIPKIPVCVSNYTADNEDMSMCEIIHKLSKIVSGRVSNLK